MCVFSWLCIFNIGNSGILGYTQTPGPYTCDRVSVWCLYITQSKGDKYLCQSHEDEHQPTSLSKKATTLCWLQDLFARNCRKGQYCKWPLTWHFLSYTSSLTVKTSAREWHPSKGKDNSWLFLSTDFQTGISAVWNASAWYLCHALAYISWLLTLGVSIFWWNVTFWSLIK